MLKAKRSVPYGALQTPPPKGGSNVVSGITRRDKVSLLLFPTKDFKFKRTVSGNDVQRRDREDNTLYLLSYPTKDLLSTPACIRGQRTGQLLRNVSGLALQRPTKSKWIFEGSQTHCVVRIPSPRLAAYCLKTNIPCADIPCKSEHASQNQHQCLESIVE